MRITAIFVIVIALALPLCAQSGLPPEVLLLSRIRHRAEADLARLPDFTCLETVERSDRNSPVKEFAIRDIVRVEVARVGAHELFAWPGESHFENRPLAAMVGTGMTSSGEYSGHARSVFVGSSALIHYVDEEDLGGHRAAHYDYEISPAFSGYTVAVNGREGTVGSRGSFWADTTSFDLLRLTVEGTEIPPQLGIRAILTSIDYGRLHIASGDFLLPQSAVTWIGHDSGLENRNRTEFTHCREYATQSVLSFDTSAESSAPAPSKIPVELTIPAGVTISVRLQTPVLRESAKIGDALTAVLDSDVKHNGQLIAPKGAVISGRLRIFQKEKEAYAVGLEFTDLTFENKHARWFAKLVSVDSKFAQQELRGTQKSAAFSGPVPVVTRQSPPELSGVATFFIAPGAAQLPRGMLMIWRTEALSK